MVTMPRTRGSSLFIPATLLFFHTQCYHQVKAKTLKVTPTGQWTALSGYSGSSTIYTLPYALSIAKAGDTINLADGEYSDRVDSVTAGESGKPIRITGSEYAVIRAVSPLVRIQHSWITLQVRERQHCKKLVLFSSVYFIKMFRRGRSTQSTQSHPTLQVQHGKCLSV